MLKLIKVFGQVEVSVFYESRCSDSKHFITEQLHPTYKKMGEDLVRSKNELPTVFLELNIFFQIVDFKPFGKANVIPFKFIYLNLRIFLHIFSTTS